MSIETMWKELGRATERPVARRVDESHPHDLYLSLDARDRVGLLLLAAEEPPIAPTYETIEIIRAKRADGRWVLQLSLTGQGLESQFEHLCRDIVESMRAVPESSNPGKLLLKRLARWRRLMESGRRTGMGENEIRGLVGELLYLGRVAMPTWDVPTAVDGWTGPLGESHDFRLPGTDVEVKTVHPPATVVRISSLDQLDDGGGELELSVVSLAPARAEDPEAFSLTSLVSLTREIAEADAESSKKLEDKLAIVGYEDREEYSTVNFKCNWIRRYNVRPGFPRILRSDVPSGVRNGTYDIDLASCIDFLTEND